MSNKLITIAGADIEVGDELFVGGNHPAFYWETVRSVEIHPVPVRLEGGSETTVPGRLLRYGALGLGMKLVLDQEGIAIRRWNSRALPENASDSLAGAKP